MSNNKFKKVLMRLVEEMAGAGSGSDDDSKMPVASPKAPAKRRGRPPKVGKAEAVESVEKTVVPVELVKAVKQIGQNIHELQPLENAEMKHTGAAHRGISDTKQMYEAESAIKSAGAQIGQAHSDELKALRAEVDALKSGKKTKAKAEKFVGKAAKVADKEKAKKVNLKKAKGKSSQELEEAGKLSAVQGEVLRERPGSGVLGQTVKPSPHKTIDPLVFSNLAKMGLSS